MKWIRYTIDTTTEAEDFLSAVLDDLGVEGIEIENHVPLTREETGEMFIDFPADLGPDDGSSRVSFYLDPQEDHTQLIFDLKSEIESMRAFIDPGPGIIHVSETEDADWQNNWKEFFHAFTVGKILIKPTWEALPADAAAETVIEIDPGLSFGTGKHETTQLCIRALQQYVTDGCEAADIGCGSGILAITALKLGARHVTCVDVDQVCLTSARENFSVNGLRGEQGEFYAGNLIDDPVLRDRVGTGRYDVAAANILADVIIPMAPALAGLLKEDGILITSGIIDFKEEPVKEALEGAGLRILSVDRDGEWVGITAQKTGLFQTECGEVNP